MHIMCIWNIQFTQKQRSAWLSFKRAGSRVEIYYTFTRPENYPGGKGNRANNKCHLYLRECNYGLRVEFIIADNKDLHNLTPQNRDGAFKSRRIMRRTFKNRETRLDGRPLSPRRRDYT